LIQGMACGDATFAVPLRPRPGMPHTTVLSRQAEDLDNEEPQIATANPQSDGRIKRA